MVWAKYSLFKYLEPLGWFRGGQVFKWPASCVGVPAYSSGLDKLRPSGLERSGVVASQIQRLHFKHSRLWNQAPETTTNVVVQP